MDPAGKGRPPGGPAGLSDQDRDEQVRCGRAAHLRGDEQKQDGLRADSERADRQRSDVDVDDLREDAEQIRRERIDAAERAENLRREQDFGLRADAEHVDDLRADVNTDCQQADINVHVDRLRADDVDAGRGPNVNDFQLEDRQRDVDGVQGEIRRERVHAWRTDADVHLARDGSLRADCKAVHANRDRSVDSAIRGAEAVRGQHDNVDVADAGQGLRDQHVTVRGHERGAALHGEDDLSLFAPLAFGNEEAGAVPRFGYGNHERREAGIGIRSSTSDSDIGLNVQRVDARIPLQETEVDQEELSRALEGVHLQEHGRDPVHEDGAERGQPQHALAGEDALGQVAPAAHVDADGEVDELQLGDDAASVERRGRGINYAASISDFDDDEDIGLTAMFERSRNIVNTLEADLRPWKDIILNPNQRPTVHTVEMGINIFSRRARELAECLRWAILRFEFLEEEFSQEEIQRQLDVITFGRQWSRDLYSLFCEINSNVSLKDKALAKTFVRAADLLAATAFQNALAYAHKSGFEEPEFELRSYHSVGTASTASGITASLRRRGRLNTIFSDAEKLDIRVSKRR